MPRWQIPTRLVDKLSGRAWDHVEKLEVEDLEGPDGLRLFMDHMEKRFDRLEALRMGRDLDAFFYDFARERGQEIADYDSAFCNHISRLERQMGEMPPLMKAHFFLRKAKLPGTVESQLVSGAGHQYTYERIRDGMLLAVPSVGMLSGGRSGFHSGGGGSGTETGKSREHRVHATDAGLTDVEPAVPEVQAPEDDWSSQSATTEDEVASDEPDEITSFVTQAKKQRNHAVRARNFFRRKKEDPAAREARIAKLKQKLPCSGCKKFGHWIRECPARKQENLSTPCMTDCGAVLGLDSPTSGEPAVDTAVFELPAEALTCVMHESTDQLLMLVDTACARIVLGREWADEYRRRMQHDHGWEVPTFAENFAFRFGPGPRLWSQDGIVCAIQCDGDAVVLVRASVLDQLGRLALFSKPCMRSLKAVVDLDSNTLFFKQVGQGVKLVDLSTHVAMSLANLRACPTAQIANSGDLVVVGGGAEYLGLERIKMYSVHVCYLDSQLEFTTLSPKKPRPIQTLNQAEKHLGLPR